MCLWFVWLISSKLHCQNCTSEHSVTELTWNIQLDPVQNQLLYLYRLYLSRIRLVLKKKNSYIDWLFYTENMQKYKWLRCHKVCCYCKGFSNERNSFLIVSKLKPMPFLEVLIYKSILMIFFHIYIYIYRKQRTWKNAHNISIQKYVHCTLTLIHWCKITLIRAKQLFK